jgi:tetratricopeptide (TPR) repeat protein
MRGGGAPATSLHQFSRTDRFVDNATKRELKQPDKFVTLTDHGIAWAKENRQSAIITSVLVLAVILVLVGGLAFYSHRSDEANTALGNALNTYQTPIAAPGQQVPPGMKTFTSVKDRAQAANPQFADVASRYGMTKDGKVALYFAGITFIEEGQNQSAEDALKSVASSWNGDLAALAKLALAQLYHQTGRGDQAVALYQDLAKGNATTISPGLARIELAEMYESEGKIDDARKIYAELKDKDKEKGKDGKDKPGPIGALAAEKLNPAAAAGPEAQ